jgi:hypothetical protein
MRMCLFLYANEVVQLRDQATHLRAVLQLAHIVELVEAEARTDRR